MPVRVRARVDVLSYGASGAMMRSYGTHNTDDNQCDDRIQPNCERLRNGGSAAG